jgi:hypothetical protein
MLQIAEKPFNEWDLQLLAMVKDFTLNAYRRAAEVQEVNEHWYGLNLCWSIIQSRQGLADADGSVAIASSTTTSSSPPTATTTPSTPVAAPLTPVAAKVESKDMKSDDRFPHPDVTAAAMTTFLSLLGTEYAMSQRGRYMNK